MSRAELLAALRRDGEEQLQRLRSEAEKRRAALAAATADRCRALRADAETRWECEARREQERCRRQGCGRARAILLQADATLATRLKEEARALLPELAESAPQLFCACAAELPSLPWARVRVHPRDREQAAALFPAAEIESDAQLAGGVVALGDAGRIVVDNSLVKRLDRCWDDLLPLLLADLEAGDDDPVTQP